MTPRFGGTQTRPTQGAECASSTTSENDDELRAYFAHGLLALSNERIGGDIARLPDAVHETEVGDFLLY